MFWCFFVIAVGLESYIETLSRKGNSEFSVCFLWNLFRPVLVVTIWLYMQFHKRKLLNISQNSKIPLSKKIVFQVVISQMNGRNYSSHSAHLLRVGKMRMKLSKGWITKARDAYSSTSMQVIIIACFCVLFLLAPFKIATCQTGWCSYQLFSLQILAMWI